MVEESILIALVFGLIGLISTSPVYNGGPTYFRHRGPVAVEGSSYTNHEADSDVEDARTNSQKRYENEEDLIALQSLMDEILAQRQNSEIKRYIASTFDYRNPMFNDDLDRTDYADVSGFDPLLALVPPSSLDPANEDNFDTTLMSHLLKQGAGLQNKFVLDLQDSGNIPVDHEESLTKESSTSTITTTLDTTAGSSTSLPPTNSETKAVVLSSPMPAVSKTKGQKEFPMLRPFSSSATNFENWVEHSMQHSMGGPSSSEKSKKKENKIANNDFPLDSLTEQLNQLHLQYRRKTGRSK